MLQGLAGKLIWWTASIAGALSSVACGADGVAPTLGAGEQAFVNGDDDRLEYFEVTDPAQRTAFEAFSVALMTDAAAAALAGGHLDVLPTWGQVNALCDGEPFTEQPSAAFCSGVLLDWDLVLTSGHCVDSLPLDRLRVVFGYYYQAEGELAMRADDSYSVARVITTRRDPGVQDEGGERLDYAWLELAEPARAPRRPAAAFARRPGAAESDPVISVGAGGGVPLKWDGGGRVRYARRDFDDYFIADTDTSQGSSGGGIFDERLTVLGSLARGASDFELTNAGCFATSSESDPALALEQFTYVHRAVAGLCAAGSSSVLCDPECGEPCDAGAFEPRVAYGRDGGGDGCALTGPAGATPRGLTGAALPALALAAALARRALEARAGRA